MVDETMTVGLDLTMTEAADVIIVVTVDEMRVVVAETKTNAADVMTMNSDVVEMGAVDMTMIAVG